MRHRPGKSAMVITQTFAVLSYSLQLSHFQKL